MPHIPCRLLELDLLQVLLDFSSAQGMNTYWERDYLLSELLQCGFVHHESHLYSVLWRGQHKTFIFSSRCPIWTHAWFQTTFHGAPKMGSIAWSFLEDFLFHVFCRHEQICRRGAFELLLYCPLEELFWKTCCLDYLWFIHCLSLDLEWGCLVAYMHDLLFPKLSHEKFLHWSCASKTVVNSSPRGICHRTLVTQMKPQSQCFDECCQMPAEKMIWGHSGAHYHGILSNNCKNNPDGNQKGGVLDLYLTRQVWALPPFPPTR